HKPLPAHSGPDLTICPAEALVVIGMSAGGLTVIKEVLAGLAPNLRAAVVIAHHAGDCSILPMLIAKWTKYPVRWAKTGDVLEAGRIYVAPPGHHTIVNPGGWLSVSPRERLRFVRPSIDWLFESAAGSYGERTVAVVLSGCNDDGARGARLVKVAKGRVLAQDPKTCRHASMPVATLIAIGSSRSYSPANLSGAIDASLRQI